MERMLYMPGQIGTVTVPNRIVMEPMQRHAALEDGRCSDEDVAFYVERAKGGVGLIQTGTICVCLRTGRANKRALALDSDFQIDSYRKLTDAVHRYGTIIFAELFHPGRQGLSSLNGDMPMFAPSETMCHVVKQKTRVMTEHECSVMARQFVKSAARAKCAGFDGVTLHCAHGYLLNEFLSPYTNLRTDRYGGSAEGRASIVLEIIEGIRQECGNFPIIIRISADEFLDRIGLEKAAGITPELATEYALMFERAGADAIDVSAGIYETMDVSWEPDSYRQGWKSYLAKEIRRKVHVPVICTSMIRESDYAENLLKTKVCDFVGSARTFLADPQWANKAARGNSKAIRHCVSCVHCFRCLERGDETGESIRCAVNPSACRELHTEFPFNGRGRTVLVVGAGPAGMESARFLAEHRFRVILLEQGERIGGKLGVCSEKIWLKHLVDYYQSELSRLGVSLLLGTSLDERLIRRYKPEGIVIATGIHSEARNVQVSEIADVLVVSAAGKHPHGAIHAGREAAEKMVKMIS